MFYSYDSEEYNPDHPPCWTLPKAVFSNTTSDVQSDAFASLSQPWGKYLELGPYGLSGL